MSEKNKELEEKDKALENNAKVLEEKDKALLKNAKVPSSRNYQQ